MDSQQEMHVDGSIPDIHGYWIHHPYKLFGILFVFECICAFLWAMMMARWIKRPIKPTMGCIHQ
jgi:hypothetical protein